MEREFLESLELSEEAVNAILAEQEKTVQNHQAELSALRLQHGVEMAIHKAGGRSVKAITALLDMDAIGKSQDVEKALEAAISQLKKDSGYLFETPQIPKYARFTGVKETVPAAPATLAGALRERMRK